jgi:hypothetical protein
MDPIILALLLPIATIINWIDGLIGWVGDLRSPSDREQ